MRPSVARHLSRSVILLFAATLGAPEALAQTCRVRAVGPSPGWPERPPESSARRAEAVAALEEYAFTLQEPDADRKGIRTEAVIIIQGGTIVYERYARNYNAQRKHLAWSITKSAANAITGLATLHAGVSLDDSICKHLSGVPGENCSITVRHLLQFSSGLDWQEIYEDKSNQASSVLAMLYGEGRRDMPAFVAGHRRRNEPGTSYQYSTGESTLLAAVVDAAFRKAGHGRDWPWQFLFDPLGITTATWERDASGHLIGGSYLYLGARDLARFALLFLDDGCWKGQRILPEGWVKLSTTVSDPIRNITVERDPGDVQGMQWWLNRPFADDGGRRPWPDVPEDAFAARGHWGQSATIIPSRDMIIVRFADDRDGSLSFNRFLKLAIDVGGQP